MLPIWNHCIHLRPFTEFILATSVVKYSLQQYVGMVFQIPEWRIWWNSDVFLRFFLRNIAKLLISLAQWRKYGCLGAFSPELWINSWDSHVCTIQSMLISWVCCQALCDGWIVASIFTKALPCNDFFLALRLQPWRNLAPLGRDHGLLRLPFFEYFKPINYARSTGLVCLSAIPFLS